MSNEIILSGIENPVVIIPVALIECQENLCALAARITKVSNPQEQDEAVRVAGLIKKFVNEVESQRQDSKRPVLDLGRMLDEKIKGFIHKSQNALAGITPLIATYQESERIKAQRIRDEEEKKRREALEKAQEEEAALQRKIAESKSALEQEKLEIELEKKKESFRETIVESHATVVESKPFKSKGMAVSKEYDFEVLDIHALYRANPAFVKLEANKVVIKSMLRQGMKECPGLKIFEAETKVNVRAAR